MLTEDEGCQTVSYNRENKGAIPISSMCQVNLTQRAQQQQIERQETREVKKDEEQTVSAIYTSRVE